MSSSPQIHGSLWSKGDRPVAPTFATAANLEDADKGKISPEILFDFIRPLTYFDFAYNLSKWVFSHSRGIGSTVEMEARRRCPL
ncbi:hypothetical protein DSCW_33760 [Desulfosarcina widdelii]|uniref:Uncharacterized protein n=1 Tax=Desulfosarcina widdelii TaxID=947919 RepID=A0A5K7Z6W7_9BACT|nr:hypothetical protein DSCW_33760 [Desulfosarcina widdelii]